MNGWRWLNGILAVAIFGTAVATVLVTYRYNQLHREMLKLDTQAHDLAAWREQHELSLQGYREFSRIESIARQELGMYAPSADKIKYINIEGLSAEQSKNQ